MMIRMNMMIILVLLGCVYSIVALNTAPTFPSFIWSSKPYFVNNKEGNHINLKSKVLTNELVSVVSHAVGNDKALSELSEYASSSTALKKPELIVAFIIPQTSSGMLSHELGAYSNSRPSHTLKSIIDRSTSLISAPYTTGNKLSDELIELISHSSSQAQIIDKSDCGNILKNLQQQASNSLLSNGITDLVIIQSNLIESNQCMQRLLQYVDGETNGHYIALLTSDSAPPLKLVVENTKGSSNRPVMFVQTSAIVPESIKDNVAALPYILPQARYVALATPSTMFVILLSIFLVFVLLIGVNCVVNIETPPRFATAPMQIAKEY